MFLHEQGRYNTFMSNPINTKINPYPQQFAGPGQPLQVDGEKLKQGVNNTPVGKAAQQDNPAVTFGLMIPMWLGISKLMTKFNKSCADNADGSKNTLQKIGDFGDKIDNNKILNNPVTKKVGGFWTSAKTFMRTKIINNSAVLKAFFDTPSVPTAPMVKTMAKGTIAEVANDAAQAIGKFTDGGKNLEKVAELGFKDYDKVIKDPRGHIDEIIEVCKKQSKDCLKSGDPTFVDMTKYSTRKIHWSDLGTSLTNLKSIDAAAKPAEFAAESARLSKDATAIIEKYTNGGKNLGKVSELGIKDYAKVMANPQAHVDEIIQACAKKGGAGFVEVAEKSLLQPARNLLGRQIYWSELANKMTALKGGNTFAKALPKFSLRTLEGLTNGTAGGKFAILMQSYFLADAVVKTYKAPKGEKGKTFAENIIYNVGWYMTMPFGINLMHKFGGLQYTGMSKARVAKYRQAAEQFNEKAKANGFADKAEYNAAKQSIKDMLSGKAAAAKIAEANNAGHIIKPKNLTKFYHKPLKWAAKVLTVGLENLRGFSKAGDSKFVKDMKNIPFNLKNIAGYPVRFGLFMFVIAPFLGKLCAKGSHLIFGKPTKSVLDEAKEEPKTPQAVAGQSAAAPQAQQIAPTPAPVLNPVAPGGSLVKSYVPSTQPVAPAAAQATAKATVTIQPVASQTIANKPSVAPQVSQAQKAKEPVRTYVPSSVGVQIQPKPSQSDDKLNSAFNKANVAEQEALKFIAGH